MASPNFDIRLIPEFNGNGDVVEWISKVEMVCQLQTPAADELIVIPLRLTGGASAVYRQLSVDERRHSESEIGTEERVRRRQIHLI